jgi:hypothetical protein
MLLNWLDRVSDWNPQLFREVKGRLNNRNVALATGTSVLGQLLVLSYLWLSLPSTSTYSYGQLFVWHSLVVLFALLVLGSYLLISDLAREERRGTLNFIRLSPQSAQSILMGKMLGVPILLYLAVLLSIPLHLWLGLSAEIPLIEILSLYAVLIGSCAFFYSGALLFSLVSSWFSGFQAWLGSGAILMFLCITHNKGINYSPTDWLNLFCPSVVLHYLVYRTDLEYNGDFSFSHPAMPNWEWFNIPLDATFASIVMFMLFNYGFGTYWIWQALNRRFHNPNATLISKRQSYLLTACFAEVSLGFALPSWSNGYPSQPLFDNFLSLLSINLLLLVSLIATLSPHRQALQDWARYRQNKVSALVKDLLWGEKSPAVVAIAINLVISCTIMMAWILCWPVGIEGSSRMQVISGLALTLNLLLIYATLAQIMLLMKSQWRAIWAAGTVVTVNLLPALILSLLSISPEHEWGGLWLFTSSPWDALKSVSAMFVAQVILVEWTILGVLSWQLTRQLHKVGESASKALFANSRTA